MKRKINLCFILLVLFVSLFASSADAAIFKYRKAYDNELNTEYNIIHGSETSVDCSGIFTEDAIELISDILNWIRILVPIGLVLLIAVDFGGAVLQQDNDALKKSSGKALKRVLAAIAVFLIPTIIRLLLNLPGIRDTLEIPSDPLCGTMDSVVVKEELTIK